MAEVASAFVSLLPETKGFGAKLDSGLSKEVGGAGKRQGKLFGGLMLGAAGAVLGGGALAAGFLKGALGEAREAQKVGALTVSTIKATGGAAGVTAKQVGQLSGAISAKTGIDDEAIQSGANLLLTFKNIKNGVGEGNKIFDQTTSIMTDMATAMGTEPKSAAIQLGKALNDPIKGVGALSRVGVTFTEGQKNTIKSLVDSGKTMDAQKIILRELNSEFGGAAEAQATAGDKFKTAFGNLQESVGTALLPALDSVLSVGTKFAVFLTNDIGPGIAALNGYLAPAIQSVKGFFGALGGGGAASGLVTTFKSIGSSIAANFLPVIKTMATTFTTVILPVLARVGSYLAANLMPIFRQVGTVIATQVVPVIASLARFFYGTLLPALVRIATQIGGSLKPVFTALFQVIQTSVLPTVSKLLAKFREWWPTISRVIVIVAKVIGAVLRLAAAILGKVLPPLIRFAGFLIRNVVNAVLAVIGVLVKIVAGVIRVGAAFINSVQAVARWVTGVKTKVGDAIGIIKDIPGRAKSALGNLGGVLVSAGGQIIDGLANGIRNAAGRVMDAVRAVVNLIPKKVREIMGIASPSKVMRGFGVNIGEGLALGMNDAQGKVDLAATRLSSRIQVAAPRMDGLITGPAGPGAAGAGGRTINVYPRTERVEDIAQEIIRRDAFAGSA